MSIQKIVFNTDLYCNDLHAAVLYGDGSMLTGLPSSNNNYQGGANNVVLTNNNGNLTDQAYLPVANGGLACDASAFNGIVKANAGTFSGSTIVDADIDVNANISISKLNSYPNDNTKVLLADGTWAQVSDNQISGVNVSKLSGYPNDSNQMLRGDGDWSKIVNANIDNSAAIDISKLADFPNDNNKVLLADGTWNYVGNNQINDVNVNKLSNPEDANQVLCGDTNWRAISNNQIDNAAAIDRNKLATGTINQFCLNDNSGNLTDTAALVLNADDLEMNPNNDVVIKKKVYLDANKKHLLNQECELSTSNNTAADFYTLACAANKSYLVNFEILVVNTTDANASGILNGYVKLNQGNPGATPDCSYIIQNASILDSALANIVVDTNVSANTFKLQCTGLAAKTLNWYGYVKFIML